MSEIEISKFVHINKKIYVLAEYLCSILRSVKSMSQSKYRFLNSSLLTLSLTLVCSRIQYHVLFSETTCRQRQLVPQRKLNLNVG